MVQPARAPVRPRIYRSGADEARLLEDDVRSMLDAGHRGVVLLNGTDGAGKTTALAHLAAVFAGDERLQCYDGELSDAVADQDKSLIVCSGNGFRLLCNRPEFQLLHAPPCSLRLAGWTPDEFIEYLLAAHKSNCVSVMARLQPDDCRRLSGTPEIWRIVLDQLALDHDLPDAHAALERHLNAELRSSDNQQGAIRRACLCSVLDGDSQNSMQEALQGVPGHLKCLVRHPPVQDLLAARQAAEELRSTDDCDFLGGRVPQELIRNVAALIRTDKSVLKRLDKMAHAQPLRQAMAVSLLHAAGADWHPSPFRRAMLSGACLSGVEWANVILERADLSNADLHYAYLRGANLNLCNARGVNLESSYLAGASMIGIVCREARLSLADLSSVQAQHARFIDAQLQGVNLENARLDQANFTGADLTRARFRGADLTAAVFSRAVLEDADFSDAVLDRVRMAGLGMCHACFAGAQFCEARLMRCDLEGMNLNGVNFECARMEEASLTGASLVGANLSGACLRDAYLAEINAEGACLRGADLENATFHMGSSRSGLLFTPIASEGTRTGFYTDDYVEQHFKSPEEIRSANLCGADLRGALVDQTDFYLVDLRGALYDSEQAAHFRRCGAILGRRVESDGGAA